jgi:iron complex outermembrane recepter protein
LDTFDIEGRHRFPVGEHQDLVWGLGYRFSENNVDNSPALAFLPAHLTRHLVTGFVQDELKLAQDRVRLAVGTKLEHNDYTGFEYQRLGRNLPRCAHALSD